MAARNRTSGNDCDSSATLINDMVVFGPSRYDAVVTYENLALQLAPNARNRWNDDLIYPS